MDKKGESCEKCLFVKPPELLAKVGGNDAGGQFFCRFNPPSVHMIPVQDMAGQVSYTVQPIDVPVMPENWCGRFECAVEHGSLLN